ncbi:FtsX-like permease family protein [Ramlibacter sp. GTP1]|uniref:FtsX-like permease family protein n=2 Tax=Ramlibacter albus TaxID=2079448 RepID=A0A923MD45_9BURK|nr:FtsX-like permease family protein [Ramlibacter albus]
MLGVALAFAVQLINASALGEFSSAMRSINGEPDVELRAVQGGFDEALYGKVGTDRAVAVASPVLEVQTFAAGEAKQRVALRVLGIDALSVTSIAPGLMPTPASGSDRFELFAPGAVYLNASARQQLGSGTIELQAGMSMKRVRVAGAVAAGGGPLAVMDIGAAQELFGRIGELTRIDVRLQPGVQREDFIRSLALPANVQAAQPGDAAARVGELSRAYRVNLTVLALVALFTGAFLVFSVLALAVARRAPQFALLGVLGLTARQRRQLVLAESLLLGAFGSVLGIALGTGLAALALRVLGGDLGGGYFPGVAPQLQFSAVAAFVYGSLGMAAAAAGGWWPARAAARLPLAQTLKGLGTASTHTPRRAWSLLLVAAAAAFAFMPPVAGLPLAAYLSIGLLLVGGITALPSAVGLLYDRVAPRVAHRALPLLAVERARRVRESAAIAVSGVVAALSLAVALTVMVASFRESMIRWLDVLLPADLYARTAVSAGAAEAVFFTPAFLEGVKQVPGVERVQVQRMRSLQLAAERPAVTLLVREVGKADETLPMVESTRSSAAASGVPVWVSEAVVDLYGAKVGEPLHALERAFGGAKFVVAGIWRDYVRQTGAIVIDRADYVKLTGDARANELHLWLTPGADASDVQQRIRALAPDVPGLEFASASQLRAVSLRIFDRSFAVTYWLQAVAIGIGLFGVAASFSAQVLARRKEFGLLAHLGLTRRQVLAVVAGEGAAWTVIGSAAGLVLGLAVSVVLVHVVNPQSFHWTMDMQVPWVRLTLLCVAVVAAGTFTAWVAGRAAASRDAVLAVKEDW